MRYIDLMDKVCGSCGVALNTVPNPLMSKGIPLCNDCFMKERYGKVRLLTNYQIRELRNKGLTLSRIGKIANVSAERIRIIVKSTKQRSSKNIA